MTPSLDTVRIGWHPTKFEKAMHTLSGVNKDKNGVAYTPDVQHVGTLQEFMDTEFDTDAHATCYNVEGLDSWSLLGKKVLPEFEEFTQVTMPVLCFDYDWDEVNHSEWTREAQDKVFLKLAELEEHPVLGKWALMYTTRAGLRLVYILDQAVSVRDGEQYLAYMFTQFKAAGLGMDENCKDWTRRFRCPRVLRDGKRTSEAWHFECWPSEDILPVDLLEKIPTRAIPVHKEANLKDCGQPAHDEIEDYLYTSSPSGNRIQSAFVKDAKKALKGLRCAPCLFNPDIPLCDSGQRNDTICLYLGEAVPKIIRKISYARPEHVYALFYNPVSMLDQDQDWYAHTWHILLDIWGKEVDKYNAEEQVKAEKELQAFTEIQTIAEGMKKWCADPALHDPDQVEDFVRRHSLACVGRFFYLIGMDGCYQPFPITREQIISRIRTTYLDDILPTTTIGNAGQPQSMTVVDIQNEYSTPIETVEKRPQFDAEGIIEDINGQHPKLVSPMYRRNPDLEPTFNKDVDDWLTNFFGHAYKIGVNWIANALAFEEGAICALSLAGPPGTGKKLLTQGLAECLEHPYTASGASITGTWTDELARTPFLVINEGLPRKQGSLPFSELFKSLTAADPITVQERFKPNVQIINPMRVIFTANNQDIVYQLVRDKELTPEDRQAVGQRLLHIDQDAGASKFLLDRGEFKFTGQPGNRWIAGSNMTSDHVVAKHFLWLHSQRVKSDVQGRYLVQGNSDGDTSALQDATVAKETTADVGLAIIKMVEDNKQTSGMYADKDTGGLYVTLEAVKVYVSIMLEKKMSFYECSQALRNIELRGAQKRDGMEWHEVNCGKLLNLAEKWGIECKQLRGLVRRQLETGYTH